MGYLYPNLIAGTRTQPMTGIAPEDLGDGRVGYVLENDRAAEASLYIGPVTLHTGTDYTLSCFAANTDNMKGTKWCVINKATGSLAAYRVLDSPGPGGDMAHRAYSSLGQCSGRSAVPRAIRQRGDHGREKMCHLVRGRHAHRGHNATRMGTGRGGGVAVDER